MDEKLIGFLYATAGASVALLGKWAIDTLTRRTERSSHASYLCVRAVCELDRFAEGCVAVVRDYGPEPESGSGDLQTVPDPVFAPHDLPVDWRSIDVLTAYEILNLPGEQAAAEARISRVWDRDEAGGEETMQVRRDEYLKLGLKAATLAAQLRRVGKLPPAPDLLERLEAIDQKDKQRKAEHALRLARRRRPAELPSAEPDA